MVASASKAKVLQTPKKAQGEVDYKAKIDAVMEALTAKVTRGPAPLHPVPPAPCTSMALSLDCLGPLITDQQAGRGDGAQVQGTRGPRARDPLSPPVPAPAATLLLQSVPPPQPPNLLREVWCPVPLVPHTTVGRSSSASWSRRRTQTSWSRARRRSSLSRRSVRLLQKAEEEQGQGESARPLLCKDPKTGAYAKQPGNSLPSHTRVPLAARHHRELRPCKLAPASQAERPTLGHRWPN
jgi:hypothetical protein